MAKKGNQTIDLGFLQSDTTDSGVGAATRTTDLSSLFAQSVTTATEMQHATMIRVDRLLDNPYQPRQEMRDDSLDELAGVIRSQGFQGILVARPAAGRHGYYQLTAGHRRREAARRAGLHLLPVVVRDLTDEEMVTLAITENIQREDLTPLEEGRIYLLMSDEMGYTHEQIAREVGRKRGYIENRIRVARAPRDVQELIQAKPDSIRAVATLIKVKDPHDRAEIIQLMLAGKLTVEDLPGYVTAKSSHSALEALDAEARAAAHHPISDGTSTGKPELRITNDELRFGTEGNSSFVIRNSQFPSAGAEALAAPHTRADHDERSAIRISSAKLAAVLRYLNTYRDHSTGRRAVSEGERASLAHIKGLVDELYEKFVNNA